MRGKPKNEDLIKLSDVPKLLIELTGVTRSRATIYSWVKIGRANYASQMIKLKVSKRLGSYYTTRQWLLNFIKEIG